MTGSDMDFRLGIVALGFLIDFVGFFSGSNGARQFWVWEIKSGCRVFYGAR